MTGPGFKMTRPNDPCPCCSGKQWGRCCGEMLTQKADYVTFMRSKNGEPAYFIVANLRTNDIYTDEEGNVPVFITRAQALATAERGGLSRALGSVGLTEAKFKMFVSDMPNHYIVPGSTVLA